MSNLAVDQRYNASITRFFSTGVLNSLVRQGYSEFFNQAIVGSQLSKAIEDNMTLGNFLQSLYRYLCKNYRSEYIYKNAIANNIVLGVHSLNTAFMLTEFRVANCKADVVILNGTSAVYEIKSEFDSLDRLKRQIAAYEQAFDLIYVITSPSFIDKVEATIPSYVGIKVARPNNNNRISLRRPPKSQKANVDQEVIFDSLRKSEYTTVIKETYGRLPNVPNTQMHKVCKELFCRLSPSEAHDYMVKMLKKRGESLKLKEFIKTAPECLRAYAFNSGLNKEEAARFKEMLDSQCTDFLRI